VTTPGYAPAEATFPDWREPSARGAGERGGAGGVRRLSPIPLSPMHLRPLFGLALALALAAAPALAQQRDGNLPRMSPNASASLTLGVTEITVHYGAPSVRGRTVFGDLVPYGEVWRTGANEATALTFSTDVTVEGQAVEAGTYGLFSVPGEGSWTVVLNRAPEQWGAYQYDEAQDVLRVSVPAARAPMRETMGFSFENLSVGEGSDGVDLVMHWADARVAFRVETDTDANVEALADEAARGSDWRLPLAYARYALQTGRHMDRAVSWVDAAIARQESYAAVSTKARLQAARGEHSAAAETGTRALALGERMAEPPRDLEAFREEVTGWRAGG
jgi:hypothetical protein